MATYYDALNDFFKLNETNPLRSSAQLVYLHLLQENNRHRNCGRITVTDRELEFRTRFSKDPITDAKRILKNLGLIDFKTDKRKPSKPTEYILLFFTGGQEVGQEPKQNVGQTTGQALSSNPNLSTQRAPAKKEELKIEETSSDKVVESERESDAREMQESWLVKEWQAHGGAKLNNYLVKQLEDLEKTHAPETIKLALKKSAEGNTYTNQSFNFKFFLKNLQFVEEDAKNTSDGRERVEDKHENSERDSVKETPPLKETKFENESDSWLVKEWQAHGGAKLNSSQIWQLKCFTKGYDPEFLKFLLQKMGESGGSFGVDLYLKNLRNPEYTEPFVEIKRREIQEQFNNPVNEGRESQARENNPVNENTEVKFEELLKKYKKFSHRKRN